MAKVVIAGGSGFIGTRLSQLFQNDGIEVILLSRSPGEGREQWDAKTVGPWAKQLDGAHAVINLSGKSISVKFSEENKREIVASRLESAKAIGDAILTCNRAPRIWLNSSAVGFYGDRGSEVLNEDSEAGTGFLAETCVAWEKACQEHPAQLPKAIIRTGLVLDHSGGALKPLTLLTKLFLGGHAGSGDQWMPWIHLQDIVRLMTRVVEDGETGIWNASAPEPVTNHEFMESLRKQLGRPWSPPIPAFVLQLVGKTVGPESALLLGSDRAVPAKALRDGFNFDYSTLPEALNALFPTSR